MPYPEPIPLYRDGRHYDELIRSLQLADLPFYAEEAKRAGGPVLELACGTGRIAIPIAQSGVDIVGLDQSASRLAHARTKADAAGVSISWVEADCRKLSLRWGAGSRSYSWRSIPCSTCMTTRRWRLCSATCAAIWLPKDGSSSRCSIRPWPS
jgi:SAM-dependent methyltransferase